MAPITAREASALAAPPTVLFDLDGTLAHTSPDIAVALNASLACYGRSITLAETERMMGDGLRALFDRALALAGLAFDAAMADFAYETFTTRYREAPARLSSVHPWVSDALIELHGEGARLAVCTNKAEDIAIAILETLGLMPWLHAVVGHTPGRQKKPSANLVRLAIHSADGVAARAVLVGDSRADVEAARAAGIPVVVVPHGYGAELAARLGADQVVTTASGLRAAIADLLRDKREAGAETRSV